MSTSTNRPTYMKIALSHRDRRQHRRHDMERQTINVERLESGKKLGKALGRIVDISAGGVRIRSRETDLKISPESQIRVRLELPPFAGICPFVDTSGDSLKPKREWTGWINVTRVNRVGNETEVAGKLLDMQEVDRGMLGLYLSTQPLAA